jgi:sugar lactone lactonase YvrE
MRPCFTSSCLGSLLAGVLCGLLSGCAIGSSSAPTADPGLEIQGKVQGGQQPIVSAHVYLLAANTTGYGNASLSLLTAGTGRTQDTSGGPTNGFYYVTTDGNGDFSISGDYSCTAGTQVYAYSLGGNPGAGTNSAAGLMAALGSCPSAGNFATATPFIFMNEVSTVATAYAIAGFATDALHVSSSGTAQAKAGIANAFLNVQILETLSTGAANPYPPGIATGSGPGTVPQAELNTLGNILAACVNSTGTLSGPTNPTACYTLFTSAMSGGTTGTQPTDTATAAINIAHNPVASVSALYGLSSAYAQFSPALTAQPNDFTVSILYENQVNAGFTFQTAGPLALDASGNVWSANDVVDEINPQGYDYTVGNSYLGLGGYSGFSGAVNIAIDTNGNAWAISSDALGKFNNSGTLLSPSGGYTGLGLNSPTSIAMDASNNAWIGNGPDANVVKVSSSGTLSGTYTGSGLSKPGPVAIDTSGDAWIADLSSGAIVKLSPSGSALSGATGYTAATLSAPTGIAIDHSGNVWVANSSSVSEISNTGTLISPAGGYTNSSLTGLLGIAIDGAGNAWVAGPTAIAEISSTGAFLSGATGFTASNNVDSITVDASGDVWTNYVACSYNFLYGESCSVDYQELVGAGTPVVTPLAVGVKNNKLGSQP